MTNSTQYELLDTTKKQLDRSRALISTLIADITNDELPLEHDDKCEILFMAMDQLVSAQENVHALLMQQAEVAKAMQQVADNGPHSIN